MSIKCATSSELNKHTSKKNCVSQTVRLLNVILNMILFIVQTYLSGYFSLLIPPLCFSSYWTTKYTPCPG